MNKVTQSLLVVFGAATMMTSCKVAQPAYQSWKDGHADGTRAEYVHDGLERDRAWRFREPGRFEVDFVGAPVNIDPNFAAALIFNQAQNNLNADDRIERSKQRRAQSQAGELVLALSQTRDFENPADSANIQMFTKSARRLGNIAYFRNNTIQLGKNGIVLSKDYNEAVKQAKRALRNGRYKTVVFSVAQQ